MLRRAHQRYYCWHISKIAGRIAKVRCVTVSDPRLSVKKKAQASGATWANFEFWIFLWNSDLLACGQVGAQRERKVGVCLDDRCRVHISIDTGEAVHSQGGICNGVRVWMRAQRSPTGEGARLRDGQGQIGIVDITIDQSICVQQLGRINIETARNTIWKFALLQCV